METLSESYNLFTLDALRKKPKGLDTQEGNVVILGSLELVDVSPLVDQQECKGFNDVMRLLDGVDEETMKIIEKVKQTRVDGERRHGGVVKDKKEPFCECCGKDIESSIFSFFVRSNLIEFGCCLRALRKSSL
jgi:hypothetical protein